MLALIPTAKRMIDPLTFEPEMQLTVNDFNSFEAAKVTLVRYGKGVSVYAFAEAQLFCEFADIEEGSKAVAFYNRLPRDMRKYKPRSG